MPKFPTKEDDIVALAKAMLYGFQNHGDEFPSVYGPALFAAYQSYLSARNSFIKAEAAKKLATKEKNYRLGWLLKVMKRRLKKSQVDTAGDPVKLAYIGWGPKATGQPIQVPAQPGKLAAVDVTQGGLSLVWEKPNSASLVRNYNIERRNQQEDEQFGRWMLVATAYENSVNLKNQPRGLQLEYRVKAVNTSGESQPSNSVAIVL